MPDRGRSREKSLWYPSSLSARPPNSETDFKQVVHRESPETDCNLDAPTTRKSNYDRTMHIWGYANRVRDLRNVGMNMLHGWSYGSGGEQHRSFVANRGAALAEMTTYDKGKVLAAAMSQRDNTARVRPYNDQVVESKSHLGAVSANHLRNYCTQVGRAVILWDR